MDILVLAWKNLWRNKRRSLITLAALSFSLMLMQGFHNLAIGTYARMIDSGVRAGSGHIALYKGDYNKSRDETLTFNPAKLEHQLAGMTEVVQVLPRVYLPGLAQSSRESRGILLTGMVAGSFLARKAAGINPGENHVRIALVAEQEQCVEAARAILRCLDRLQA